jgi:hypothetical protein
MRGFEYHEDFQVQYCSSSRSKGKMAFTFAAGERVRDVYKAAYERNAVVVAGAAQDVGIVGWSLAEVSLQPLEIILCRASPHLGRRPWTALKHVRSRCRQRPPD